MSASERSDDDLLADADLDAAEYALGTLTTEERLKLRQSLPQKPAVARSAAVWSLKLQPLIDIVPEREAPAAVWEKLNQSIDLIEASESADDTSHQPRLPAVEDATLLRGAAPAPDTDEYDPIEAIRQRIGELEASEARLRKRLRSSRRRAMALRLPAYLGGALAAGFAGFFALQLLELLPNAAAPERYVAVVDGDAQEPALLVWVDLKSRQVIVRPIASQDVEDDKSMELWVVEGERHRSLGLVDPEAPAQFDFENAGVGRNAIIAVSLEPKGGSPEATPTGPVLYSGKLFAEDR